MQIIYIYIYIYTYIYIYMYHMFAGSSWDCHHNFTSTSPGFRQNRSNRSTFKEGMATTQPSQCMYMHIYIYICLQQMGLFTLFPQCRGPAGRAFPCGGSRSPRAAGAYIIIIIIITIIMVWYDTA